MKNWKVPFALILSTLLVACGGGETEEVPAETAAKTDQAVEEVEADEEQAVDEADEEAEAPVDEAEEEDAEEADAEEADAETEADTAESAEPGEVSEAYTADKTSETEAVPLGEWGQMTSYSTEDDQYHTTYLRITQVTSESEDPEYIQGAFDEHNNLAEYDFQEVYPEDVELPSDVEWLIVDYEIYYPEEFPTGVYGIIENGVTFSAINPEGGGIPSQDGTSVYLALGTPEALYVDTIENSQPGDIRKARNVYTMVKEYDAFIFDLLFNLDDGENYETIFFNSK